MSSVLNSSRTLTRQVLRFLHSHGISRDDGILVGFSGGVDSLMLSRVLAELGFRQVLAHLDHALRSESATDVHHAAAHAAAINAPFVTARVDVAALAEHEGLGLEDAGRKARYAFLEAARKEQLCGWIALGHQADDLIEDVLLRLVRGAGWPALGGMCAVDPDRHLLRPLLHIPKSTLEAQLAALQLTPVTDESNASRDYRRNRLRHDVVPHLLHENPSMHRSVSRLHTLAHLDAAYWDAQLAEPLSHVTHEPDGSLSIPESQLISLHPAARFRLYVQILSALPHAPQPRFDTLCALDVALLAPQRPKIFQLSGGVHIVLKEKMVLFVHRGREGKIL